MITNTQRFPVKSMRYFAIALVLVLSLGLIAGPAFAAPGVRTLSANLTGAAEVPGPGDADGSGTARFRLFADEVCFTIQVNDIILPAIGAHIHVGSADVAGPVVIPLTPPDASGTSKGCVGADSALIRAIWDNPSAYYANVHTTDFPGGAVRGQLTK
jgi:hypothetical protein